MNPDNKRFLAKFVGNWGVAFFGPLVGGNAAETLYDVGLSFEQTIVIALLSSLLVTGLFISRELEKYAKKEK